MITKLLTNREKNVQTDNVDEIHYNRRNALITTQKYQHLRLRIWRATVGVQVPLRAPYLISKPSGDVLKVFLCYILAI
jgi:hypothetical protein